MVVVEVVYVCGVYVFPSFHLLISHDLFIVYELISLDSVFLNIFFGEFLKNSYHPLHPHSFPSASTFRGSLPKENKTNKTLTSPLCFSHLSITCSFVIVALGAAVCNTVDPFVQRALLANVHCTELLVWFSGPLASGAPSVLDPH